MIRVRSRAGKALTAISVIAWSALAVLNILSTPRKTTAVMTDGSLPRREWTIRPIRGVDLKATLSALSDFAGYSIGLVWILGLYVATTWIAVGTLSSIQFRDDVRGEYTSTVDALMLKIDEQ